MVCRIFPSRDQEPLGVFRYFYFLCELKPKLRGCVSWLWKEAEWLHQSGTACVQQLSPQARHHPESQHSWICLGFCWTRKAPQLGGASSGSSASSSWPLKPIFKIQIFPVFRNSVLYLRGLSQCNCKKLLFSFFPSFHGSLTAVILAAFRKQPLALKTFLLLQASTDTLQETLLNMKKISIPHLQSVLLKEETKAILVIKDIFLVTL